jgi:enoyl-CoA hydratase
VLTLTLNRPQKRNALSVALRTALFSALAAAESDDEIDVVVLTGADPVFCAGLDLNELGDSDQLQYVAPQWPPMSKPVIGAINDVAVNREAVLRRGANTDNYVVEVNDVSGR